MDLTWTLNFGDARSFFNGVILTAVAGYMAFCFFVRHAKITGDNDEEG